MKIEKNIPLKNYTTFKIGGPAEFFVEVHEAEELQEALQWAKDNSKDLFILGGGSNLLVSDQGIKGLVIKLSLNHLEIEGNKVIVGSGVILAYLLSEVVENDLVGLEFATGIPGTVGGAIRGNAGTYGQGMNDVVKKIKYIDDKLNIVEISGEEVGFAYRHSMFKEHKNFIIVEAELELQHGNTDETKKLIKERLAYRHDTQPHDPSAGCIFKNIKFEDVDIEDLKKRHLDIDKFAKHKKIPAGYLIEEAGLKGHTIGDAQISEKHGNYIINKGNATAEQVIMLISFIKQQIRDKYGVQLMEEVQIVA